MTFRATEFDRRSCEPTGRVLEFVADSIETASAACLHTLHAADIACHRGPSGRTVFSTRCTYCIGVARNPKIGAVGG